MMAKRVSGVAGLLVALFCGFAAAQPQDFSDPVKLARIALGDEQGSIAVGVLQGSASQRAFLHRAGAGAAVATTADGSALGASSGTQQEQLFEIGSITKVFTGLLLAQAVEKGDFSLDDSLGKVLAGTVNFQSSATAAISLRQLITHSACLPRSAPGLAESVYLADPYASLTRLEMWDALRSIQLESQPPCAAAYSNLGLALVGEILSHHYKKPWADLVSERITLPLGMKDTVQVLGDKAARLAQGYNNQAKVAGWEFKAMAGAGALRSTVSDMLIFSRAMMAGSAGPLGPASQRIREPLGMFQNSQIGYAVFIRGPEHKRSYLRDGLTGGYRAQWTISPSTQEAVIALASNAQAPITKMQSLLMAGLYPPAAQPRGTPVNAIGDYAGTYRVDKNTAIAFVAQNAKLYRRITGGGYRVLQPASADTFVDTDVGVQYVFQRHNGALASLEYSQGGGGFKALKTDEPTHTQAIVNHDNAKEYAGRYLLERSLRRNIDFDVKEEDGQLLIRSSNWQRRPVFPKPGHKDRFFYDAPNVEIQFERNEAGKIIALTLHEAGSFRLPKVSD
jgi:serine-type D-Ala-D-Ala carboxypeptidase/endopeptidase